MKRFLSILGLIGIAAVPSAAIAEGIAPKQMRTPSADPSYESNYYRYYESIPQTTLSYVEPTSGDVQIRLNNMTNSTISYQVVGDTGEIMLEPGSEVMLDDIEAPVSVFVYREDNGLIQATATSPEPGMLNVNLDETEIFQAADLSIRISPEGAVYVR